MLRCFTQLKIVHLQLFLVGHRDEENVVDDGDAVGRLRQHELPVEEANGAGSCSC